MYQLKLEVSRQLKPAQEKMKRINIPKKADMEEQISAALSSREAVCYPELSHPPCDQSRN